MTNALSRFAHGTSQFLHDVGSWALDEPMEAAASTISISTIAAGYFQGWRAALLTVTAGVGVSTAAYGLYKTGQFVHKVGQEAIEHPRTAAFVLSNVAVYSFTGLEGVMKATGLVASGAFLYSLGKVIQEYPKESAIFGTISAVGFVAGHYTEVLPAAYIVPTYLSYLLARLASLYPKEVAMTTAVSTSFLGVSYFGGARGIGAWIGTIAGGYGLYRATQFVRNHSKKIAFGASMIAASYFGGVQGAAAALVSEAALGMAYLRKKGLTLSESAKLTSFLFEGWMEEKRYPLRRAIVQQEDATLGRNMVICSRLSDLNGRVSSSCPNLLHFAARKRLVDVILTMIKRGVDWRVKDARGRIFLDHIPRPLRLYHQLEIERALEERVNKELEVAFLSLNRATHSELGANAVSIFNGRWNPIHRELKEYLISDEPMIKLDDLGRIRLRDPRAAAEA